MKYVKPLLTVCFSLFFINPSFAQPQPETIDLYVDCRRCNETYIRSEIGFVNFVRDQTDSDVHLLISQQGTGSGGDEYTLRFIGRQSFQGIDNTYRYFAQESDTDDEERRGLVKFIKIGLLPYLSGTNVIEDIGVDYVESADRRTSSSEDGWDNWVFSIDGSTSFSGEETRKSIDLSGEVEAQRITDAWKVELEYRRSFNRQTFDQEEETTTFIRENQRFEGLVVKSLGEHWSAGIRTEAGSSTRNNIALRYGGRPAIEYNVYPYSEYAEREISFLYGIGANQYNYEQTTIFGQDAELLFDQSLQIRMDFTQPWGGIRGDIRASTFLHDFSKNRLNFFFFLELQLTRGLSLNLRGDYSIINDQLFISDQGITDEEKLLDLRQSATSFSYGGSIGLRYTFGSIYNNVVNPRF